MFTLIEIIERKKVIIGAVSYLIDITNILKAWWNPVLGVLQGNDMHLWGMRVLVSVC